MNIRYTISIYTENNVGLLNRISAIFLKRHINIVSITSSESEISDIFRFIIVVDVDENQIIKLIKQIEKQIEVISAFFHTNDEIIYLETALYKVKSESLFKDHQMDEVFDCSKGHPIILKKFLGGNISLETLVIYDRILGYGKDFDKKLKDPVWETVSKRVRKYTPFLNIDVFRYKKILKEVVISGT